MGFYLAPDAVARVNATRREEFFNNTLPAIRTEMQLLGISIDELVQKLNEE